MGFKDNIKHLRKQNGLTQEQLANYLHLSRSAIASYETGRKDPTYTNLIAISNFFNICCDCLLTDPLPVTFEDLYLTTIDPQKLRIEILNSLELLDKNSLIKVYTLIRLLEF